MGFAPFNNPEIVVAVVAEHACHGSTGAGPTVHEIMKTYFEKYHPEMMAESNKGKTAPVDKPVPVEGE